MLELFGTIDKKIKNNTNNAIIGEQIVWDNENVSNAVCGKILLAVEKINCLSNSFAELKEFNNELDRLISSTVVYYWFFKETYNISRMPKNRILQEGVKKYESLKARNARLSYSFIPEKFEECQNFEFDLCIPGYEFINDDKILYFQCLYNVKQDIIECFMTADSYLMEYHCAEANKTINQLEDSTFYELDRSKQLLSQFFSNTEDGLITELIRAYIEAKQNNMDAVAILELIDYIAVKYKEAVTYFEEKYEESLKVNINKLNILLGSLRPNIASTGIPESASCEYITEELEGSLDRILEFSALSFEKVDFFKSQLEIFKKMDNKEKFDHMMPEVRNRITSIYFEIYEAVLKRMIKENVNDKAFDMFLIFGFMDSSLLTKQQTIDLGKLLDLYTNNGNVYSMKRWLMKVYNSEKSPSINELGMDYEQAMRDRKVKGPFGDNRVNVDFDNGDSRLNYEISNMFKTNHKLCYGQISTYFPVLHSDMLPNDISRVAVTVSKINESILKILNVDFSAFHREVFYTGENPAFKKEFIMKQVIPDIILVPIAGTKAIMWQELSKRSKLSPGRLIIPIFTSEDLNSLVTRLIGNFRWELCRAVMGARWNDISYKSLTSEYTDYVQGYKRNKNLSQENKDKVKVQIQRHRNNLKDIFSSDYEAWIKYEADGIRKVNKEVRAILYKYCPFKHSVREELIKQPTFSGVAAPFENERRKFVIELENRYASYVKKGHILESELEENLRYYKEL
jgi:hypothetical protein